MNTLWQYCLSPCCLKCGSYYFTDSLFCETCYQSFVQTHLQSLKNREAFLSQHYYFFDWHQGEKSTFSELVYRMKSNRSQQAWSFYAEIFFVRAQGQINFRDYAGLVPLPSANKASVHAVLFAQFLSQLTGLKVLNVLSKKSFIGEQKSLNKLERKTEQIALAEGAKAEHFTRYIFVDDILTTGQSFLQSKKALNADNSSLILTLFYRTKSLS